MSTMDKRDIDDSVGKIILGGIGLIVLVLIIVLVAPLAVMVIGFLLNPVVLFLLLIWFVVAGIFHLIRQRLTR